MPKLILPNDWKPRSYQLPAWQFLENGGLRAALYWHRRAGKDEIALNRTAVAAHERIGTYWHMLPEAAQSRKAIWDAVDQNKGKRRIDLAFPKEIRDTTREDLMFIRFKSGSTWQVVGSDNYDSLVGSPPVGVVFSEWALAKPQAWAYLRPILADNKGWSLFITTPRGPNHAYKTYQLAKKEPGWFAQLLGWKDTGVFTQEEMDSELRQYTHDYGEEEGTAFFNQEYNCSFDAPLMGSYYGYVLTRAQKEGRIGKVAVDRGINVDTAWDLGLDEHLACWLIQRYGREIRLVGYFEGKEGGFEGLVKELKATGYILGKHYFPHDLDQKELMTNQSRKATLRGWGIEPIIVPQHNLGDGINATRRMLDRTWIDEEKCIDGLNALRNYQREWDDDRKVFKNRPNHNWASHASDALRCYAAGSDDPQALEHIDRHRRTREPKQSAWAV